MTVDAFYHVTFYNRLPSIARNGIRPHSRESIGGAGLGEYKRGRIFITSPEGVSFWFERADSWAYDSSDDQLGEGWFPVVLRLPVPESFMDDCHIDRIGTREARAEAWACEATIPPEGIEIFFDGTWWPLRYLSEVDPEAGFDDEGYFLGHHENPFFWHMELDPVYRENPVQIYRFLSLAKVKKYENQARERGVSKVARSPRGFLTAYKKAGTSGNLTDYWHRRRYGFIARHMAQVKQNREPLWETVRGQKRPTRRHLALIMWAYSPEPSKL